MPLAESQVLLMLLEIRDLTIDFVSADRSTRAVDGCSLQLEAGQTVGIVGESGSGKTTLGLAITRLLPQPPAVIRNGSVRFGDRDLLQLAEPELRRVRGRDITYVFQEPSTALNPVMTIGRQLIEVLELHSNLHGEPARARTVELLTTVGIPSPAERLSSFPHELSGGMKQRVMIAMAVAAKPKLLIADEPTTALDVTLERQIVLLLKRLQAELGLSLLMISHNIHLVRRMADTMVVMWQGRIVESGPTERILKSPAHPYTRQLLDAQPRIPALESAP